MVKDILKNSYQSAGVDIDKADKMLEELSAVFSATHAPEVMGSTGGFAGMFDISKLRYKQPVIVSATDGVGTKLLLAHEQGQYNHLGTDLVAMCVNDLIVSSAKPLFFLDYLSCGTLEEDQAQTIIRSIANACTMADCSLIGGETAEMPGLYRNGTFDLAGFAVGIVEKDRILTKDLVKNKDRIIAVKSSGPHSNGFSLIRHIVSQQQNTNIPYQALLRPTIIYEKLLRPLLDQSLVHSLAHITGGGITNNLPRALPQGAVAKLLRNWELPEPFDWLQAKGNIQQDEMDRVFNQGIGMIAVTDRDKAKQVMKILNRVASDTAWDIGEVLLNDNNSPARIEWVHNP